MANTVYLGPAECPVDVTELVASEVIAPGTILVETSGEAALAGADQGGIVYVALENILEEITDSYAADDTVQCARPTSGEYYQVVLAASQVAVKDGPLTTNANGELILLAANDNVVCYADETKTSVGATTIRVYFK